MKTKLKFVLLSLLGASAACQAGDGLVVPDATWQRWQARIAVSTYESSTRLAAASLVGDYYFQGLRLGESGRTGGFRATSGLLLGAGSAALGAAGVPIRLTGGMALGRLSLSAMPLGAEPVDAGSTLPYLGVGYTSVAAGGGWGFTADLGVVAQNPSASTALGRALFGSQSVDAAFRNLRLSPVLQLGVRYNF